MRDQCSVFWDQLSALLRKAKVTRQRRYWRVVLELLLPLLLVSPLAVVRAVSHETLVPAKTNVDRAVHLGDPFKTKYASRLCRGGLFGIAPADGIGKQFRRFLRGRFDISGTWPKLRPFQGSTDIEAYIAASDYGDEELRPMLCGAVIFGVKPNHGGIEYTIRLNGTIAGNRGAVCGGVDTRRITGGRAIDTQMTSKDWYLCSGFLALQNLVDEFLMSRNQLQWQLDVSMVPFPTPSRLSHTGLQLAQQLLTLIITLFFAFMAGQITGQVVLERERKLLETMRLTGLRDCAWFAAHTLNALPPFAFYGFEFAVVLSVGLFSRSSALLVGIFFMTASSSIAAMALCAASIFDVAKTASLASVVGVFAITRIPLEGSAACLLPPVGLVQGINRIVELELEDRGLNWHTFWQASGQSQSGAALVGILGFDILMYLVLWAYLERVVPHQFGTAPCPWYRPWQVTSSAEAGRPAQGPRRRAVRSGAGIVEDAMPVACVVEAISLRKEYELGGHGGALRMVAVEHLDLGMAENEILALLGHNGAGKSTTVGMLTGALRPTRGAVYIRGFDVSKQAAEARQYVGVCMQTEALFDELTASDHLHLASALRRVDPSQEAAAEDLLHDVGLHKVAAARTPAGALPAGQRRALSVALAFVGKPHFIVLDEPTSGMDPFVRRRMWELLKRHRTGRAICLSTHYMDEAEMLGDQVCILSRGALQCYGSPDWLKVRLGSGYTLTLSRLEDATSSLEDSAKAAVDLAQRSVPKEVRQGVLSSCGGSEVTIRVPFSASRSLPELLRSLDSQKAKLGLGSLTVSATTLEELFLRLADGVQEASARAPAMPLPTSSKASLSNTTRSTTTTIMSSDSAASFEHLLGELAAAPSRPTNFQLGTALLMKRWQSARRNTRSLLCVCLLPLFFNLLGLASIAASFELDSPPLELMGTAEDLAAGSPGLTVAYTSEGGKLWGALQRRRSLELLEAGVKAGLWRGADYILENATMRRATSPRNWQKDLIADASFINAPSDGVETTDLSKYQEMKAKGAPDFVIRKVMEKDGLPGDMVDRVMDGAGGDISPTRASLTAGLQNKVQLSMDPLNNRMSAQFEFGRAPLRVDTSRPEHLREELASCAAGGAAQVAAAEEAMVRLDSETKRNLQAMQDGGAPLMAQRAYLDQMGLAPDEVSALVASTSTEEVPPEQAMQLIRCAMWQSFAVALLNRTQEAAFGAYKFETVDLGARRARVAVFYNTSAPHTAPLFLGLLRQATGAATSASSKRASLPQAGVVVRNWPLPLTTLQRNKAFSAQGFSFLTMSLIGAAFLPASSAADAAQEIWSGAWKQRQLVFLQKYSW